MQGGLAEVTIRPPWRRAVERLSAAKPILRATPVPDFGRWERPSPKAMRGYAGTITRAQFAFPAFRLGIALFYLAFTCLAFT
jgi:hypothetical protein